MLLVAVPQGLFMHGLQPRARTLPTLMKLGYDVDRFAGRYALGKNLPAVESKSGFTLARSGAGEVRLLGGACSEVLGGANLANLLHKGYELEVSAMEAMRRALSWPTLSAPPSVPRATPTLKARRSCMYSARRMRLFRSCSMAAGTARTMSEWLVVTALLRADQTSSSVFCRFSEGAPDGEKATHVEDSVDPVRDLEIIDRRASCRERV